MGLIGKWTKIEQIESETEIQIVKVNYPSELPDGHPDFDKAGTTEDVEFPKRDILETVYNDVYVVVHSINSWKHIIGDKTESLFNICYRIYNTKEDRLKDYDSFIYEDHIVSVKVDYTLEESEIQQAYKLVNSQQGLEELIND